MATQIDILEARMSQLSTDMLALQARVAKLERTSGAEPPRSVVLGEVVPAVVDDVDAPAEGVMPVKRPVPGEPQGVTVTRSTAGQIPTTAVVRKHSTPRR